MRAAIHKYNVWYEEAQPKYAILVMTKICFKWQTKPSYRK